VDPIHTSLHGTGFSLLLYHEYNKHVSLNKHAITHVPRNMSYITWRGTINSGLKHM